MLMTGSKKESTLGFYENAVYNSNDKLHLSNGYRSKHQGWYFPGVYFFLIFFLNSVGDIPIFFLNCAER